MSDVEDVSDLLRQLPHWRVVLRPEPYLPSRIALSEGLNAIEKATVSLRGWNYPHLNRRVPPLVGVNWVGSQDDFSGHLEHWRLYQSGQFAHLFAIREARERAWHERLMRVARHEILVPWPDFNWESVPGFIEIVNFVWTVTEIFEFAARLVPMLGEVEQLTISIRLEHIPNFVLAIDDFKRAWWNYYAAQEDTLENTWRIGAVDLVSLSRDRALEAILWFLQRFGWLEPNIEVIRQDQESLLQRGGH